MVQYRSLQSLQILNTSATWVWGFLMLSLVVLDIQHLVDGFLCLRERRTSETKAAIKPTHDAYGQNMGGVSMVTCATCDNSRNLVFELSLLKPSSCRKKEWQWRSQQRTRWVNYLTSSWVKTGTVSRSAASFKKKTFSPRNLNFRCWLSYHLSSAHGRLQLVSP